MAAWALGTTDRQKRNEHIKRTGSHYVPCTAPGMHMYQGIFLVNQIPWAPHLEGNKVLERDPLPPPEERGAVVRYWHTVKG